MVFRIIYLFIFIISFFNIYSEEANTSERIYMFKVLSFNKKIEVYCTKRPMGYYKYPQKVNTEIVYLTYETNEFYNQCTWDENFTVFNQFYPMTIWTNSKGEVLRLKKRYGPVIQKDREKKHYPYGFGKN